MKGSPACPCADLTLVLPIFQDEVINNVQIKLICSGGTKCGFMKAITNRRGR